VRAIRFHAPELALAVKEIARLHTQAGRGAKREGTSWLAELLEELARLPASKHTAIIARLTDAELGALVNHARTLRDDPLLGVVLRAVSTRSRTVVSRGLWGLVGHLFEEEVLREVLSSTVADPVWEGLVEPRAMAFKDFLSSSETVLERLSADWIIEGTKFVEFVTELSIFAPRTEPGDWESIPLGKRLLKQGLIGKGTHMLLFEEARDLQRWAQQLLTAGEYPVFAARYVNTIEPGDWDEPLLTDLVNRLGDPRVEPGNWLNLKRGRYEELVRWINRHKLSQFFIDGAGDRERFDFWNKFVDSMGPGSEGRIREGQGFFEFPGFGVIEFMEKGNAAYIYDLEVYEGFRSRKHVSNFALKDRDRLMRDELGLRSGVSSSEMRILHFTGWQTEWSAVIHGYIKNGGDR